MLRQKHGEMAMTNCILEPVMLNHSSSTCRLPFNRHDIDTDGIACDHAHDHDIDINNVALPSGKNMTGSS
jgi:hypothetical protein